MTDKSKVSIKGATTSASTTDIFTQSGSDEDGDLFASSAATAKKHEPSAEPVKPTQPPAQPSVQKKVRKTERTKLMCTPPCNQFDEKEHSVTTAIVY